MSKKYVLKRPPRRPGPDLAAELDEEQYAAATAPATYVLAVAGAGSGKTRTLTYRAAYLIGRGTPPQRVMLCTFTNRAAQEMLRRVQQVASVPTGKLWAGTFHRIGNLVLRTYGERLGGTRDFSILDRADATELMTRVIADQPGLAKNQRLPQPNVLCAMLSFIANTRRPVSSVLQHEYVRFAELQDVIELLAAQYAATKRKMNVVDFDDLLVGWREALLHHPAVAAELKDRFKHVLVDEYQDVNRLQAEITDVMAEGHESLTVVGDDDQSIYAFRGANLDSILTFPERHPQTKIFRVQTNYRSTPQILALANRSIQNNRARHDKTLRPARGDGPLPVVVAADDVYQQAEFVAQRILDLHQEDGIPLSEIAVLVRAHGHSLELQVELTNRGIPFQVRAGLRFFEQAHIKDALAYLRWLSNPDDSLAAQRVLRLHTGVGTATATRVSEAVAARDRPVAEALASLLAAGEIPARARDTADRLATVFARMAEAESGGGPAEALRVAIDGDYRAYAETRFENAAERLDDLERLAEHAQRYERAATLLGEIALMAGIAVEDGQPDEEEPDDLLVLSTIHQAKGLEWNSVFIIWLSEGHFPSRLALRDPGGDEEERRLFYVGVTRARDQLILVYPNMADRRGVGRVITRPSRFLAELEGASLFERWRLEVETAP